jgi:hypothetical protein
MWNTLVIGSLIIFFLPSVLAFLKAFTTSSAFAHQHQLVHFRLQQLQLLENLTSFHPVTFETRLILINRSTSLGSCVFGVRRDFSIYFFKSLLIKDI